MAMALGDLLCGLRRQAAVDPASRRMTAGVRLEGADRTSLKAWG